MTKTGLLKTLSNYDINNKTKKVLRYKVIKIRIRIFILSHSYFSQTPLKCVKMKLILIKHNHMEFGYINPQI